MPFPLPDFPEPGFLGLPDALSPDSVSLITDFPGAVSAPPADVHPLFAPLSDLASDTAAALAGSIRDALDEADGLVPPGVIPDLMEGAGEDMLGAVKSLFSIGQSEKTLIGS